MITRRHFVVLAAASTFPPLIGARARAQTWPARPVRLIVPLAAGGPTDFVARLVADGLTKIWGQQVVIENRSGAGTNIAAEVVARSDPDGYTVLFATSSVAVNRTLYRSLSYDPIADLVPVSHLTSFPFFLFVPNAVPAKSVKEFIAFARANSGNVTFGSPGTGSMPHLASELFKRMAGIEMTHVPYRGAAPALNDLIPGRIQFYIGSGALLENMRAGQVRGLAVTGATRDPAAPELPTVAEAGVPGYDVSSWHGLFVPAKTPPHVIRKINTDTVAALADGATTRRLEQAGYMVVGSTPEEFATLLKSEIDKWGAVIKEAGVKID
jgi:tripartite-type tricarboxylate transporter receptor subunit TctC